MRDDYAKYFATGLFCLNRNLNEIISRKKKQKQLAKYKNFNVTSCSQENFDHFPVALVGPETFYISISAKFAPLIL